MTHSYIYSNSSQKWIPVDKTTYDLEVELNMKNAWINSLDDDDDDEISPPIKWKYSKIRQKWIGKAKIFKERVNNKLRKRK